VIAAAEAEYLRNPSEALREKLQNMVQSPAAAVQQADVMRHAHKKEQTANLIGQVDCIRTIAPHAAKKARTEHAATEKPERDLAEKLGIEYRPSSGVQALAEIADHFHNLANLAPGTKLSEAQVDGFLKSL
jgi:hypothetical protein